MNLRTLILRSLRFHWRNHLGVLLGATVGSAALMGALIVGDSVRGSLRELGWQRLGNVHSAMDTGDRLFRARLGELIELGLDDPEKKRPNVYVITGTVFTASSFSNRLVKLTTTNRVSLGPGQWSLLSGTNYVVNV